MKFEVMVKLRVVVLIGVGILVELGIKIFCVVDGLWEEYWVEDVVMLEGFVCDLVLVQVFYNVCCCQLQSLEIVLNVVYLVLVCLEDLLGDYFLLVIQNIDNLYECVGNCWVIYMYGELLKVCCLWSGQVLEWIGDVIVEDKCYCCQFLVVLCLYVVWFGEMLLGMDEIYSVLVDVDIFIVIGIFGYVYLVVGFVYEV